LSTNSIRSLAFRHFQQRCDGVPILPVSSHPAGRAAWKPRPATEWLILKMHQPEPLNPPRR
jgi:hypothetical protein